jgi:hypothetical protein
MIQHVRLALIHTGFYYFYNVLSLRITVVAVQTIDFNPKRTC